MANRLGGGCKVQLIFEHFGPSKVEIRCWIVFDSEAHNPHNCYCLGINQLFLMDILIFKIKLENMAFTMDYLFCDFIDSLWNSTFIFII